MEDDAEQAALVHSLVREVQGIVPITDDILQEQFVRLYNENDPQVHLEVSSVLASRGDDFKPQDLQVLKLLMDSHCAPQQVTMIDAMTKLEDSQASIDEQEFQLIMNQLIHDRDAWRVHRHTLSNYAASVAKMKHDWNIKRHEQSGKAADAFIKQHCLVQVYKKDSTKPVVDFRTWKKSLAARHQIPEERGYTFALCNLAAPSMLQSNCLAFYGSCASCMAQGQNLMAVVMPQFAYTNSQLALSSQSVEDNFINCGLPMETRL